MVSRETLLQIYFPTELQQNQIERYYQYLAKEGLDWGLIGPREIERLWERHIFNCLPITKYLQPNEKVVDIGSGAGLPGLVLAINRPDLQITLIEPLERRVEFLKLVTKNLELETRVQVIRSSAQEFKGKFNTVTARAVANTSKLFEISKHLVAPKGRILAIKGEKAEQELKEWLEKPQVREVIKGWEGLVIKDFDPNLGQNNLIELKHL